MEWFELIYTAAKRSGLTVGHVSQALGKSQNYIAAARTRGSLPSVANAAAQLDAAGWALVAVPAAHIPADALRIDASPITDAQRRAALERDAAAAQRRADDLAAQLAAMDAGESMG